MKINVLKFGIKPLEIFCLENAKQRLTYHQKSYYRDRTATFRNKYYAENQLSASIVEILIQVHTLYVRQSTRGAPRYGEAEKLKVKKLWSCPLKFGIGQLCLSCLSILCAEVGEAGN